MMARDAADRASAPSRRSLLKGGALVVAFSLLPGPALRALAADAADPPGARPIDPNQVDSYLAFHADGSVTVSCGKVDLGTGLRIAMRQMAAEELGLGVERIALVEGDTALTPDQGPTAGSTGVARGGVQVRQAAATARQALIKMGAARLNRPAAELDLGDGEVRPLGGKPGSGVAVAALLGDRRFELAIDPKAPLRDPDAYRFVGKPLPRPDLPEKVTGRHVYIQDFAVAGMLHARVVRPPAVGARLDSVDESSVAAITGARAVRINDFLAVVAEDEWSAIRAARALQAKWTGGGGLPDQERLFDELANATPIRDETLIAKGDLSALGGAGGARVLRASYRWPIQSHASLGPSCAVADVKPDGATVWTASQATHRLRHTLVAVLGLPLEKVRAIYLDGAGCYGMNGHDDAAAEAALLSQQAGRPVRVQWMREEEHGWDPKGPPQRIDLVAALDHQGAIAAWQTETWLPATTAGLTHIPLLAPAAAGRGEPQGVQAGLLSQNLDPCYPVANQRVTVHWLDGTPLRASNLRAPGKVANCFAVEGFVDELAAAAGQDPVAFRLARLDDPRGAEVVRRAAALFGWEARKAGGRAQSGKTVTGRGFAYVHYKQNENYVALAIEIAVDADSGAIRPLRVACAHDCGLVVNPDALRNQIEGGIVQTLSRTLHEEVTFDRNRVTSTDWASYPILTFPEVPEIKVDLVDRPRDPPMGGGEAVCATVAAALGNAVFDALNLRLRTAPFTPARVKAALTRSS